MQNTSSPQGIAKRNIEAVQRILASELNEINTEAAETLLQETLTLINTIRILEGWKHGKQY